LEHARRAALIVLAALAAGCSGVVTRATDDLSRAVLEHDDPLTVRDGAPAYLLLMDALVNGDPEDAGKLAAASQLYAAYAALFVDEPARQARLASRARGYATRAACATDDALCGLDQAGFDAFEPAVGAYGEDPDDAAILVTLAQAWLLDIRARSSDWAAIAELPKPQALLARALALDPDRAQAHLYLGILETVRPPAYGGRPDEGRRHFERAIELTGGHDLSAKVQFAESYARLVYDRELHDRLLNEVLDAPTEAPRLTLQNSFAKQRARALLGSADDYF
jgi:hypothetical protein